MRQIEIIEEIRDIQFYFVGLVAKHKIATGKVNLELEAHVHRLGELVNMLSSKEVDCLFFQDKLAIQQEAHEKQIEFLKSLLK